MVRAPHRVGVDPKPLFDLDPNRLPKNASISAVTSDEFFGATRVDTSFDVVFLDGLHTFRQTYHDLINALRVCRSGVIVVDDVVPGDEVSAMPDQSESVAERKRRNLPGDAWYGDVFKVILCVHKYHPELRVRTVVGSGNPQALIWLETLGTPGVRNPTTSLLNHSETLSTSLSARPLRSL